MQQLHTSERPRRLTRVFDALGRRPHRTLVLPALGAALGLLIAGIGLFRAAPIPVTTVPPGYVALVNQRAILMSDFVKQVESELGVTFAEATVEQRRQVLREMIDEELLVQRGLALDLPELEVEARSALVDGVNTLVGAPLLAQAPTDAELRAFYTAHRSDYAAGGDMRVRDIVLHVGGYQNVNQSTAQAEADAEEAIYQLRSGAALDYVMQHFGFVDSGLLESGEQSDFIAKLRLGPQLFQVASALRDGEVSEPVATPDGVHVLVMERRRPPRFTEFEAARNQVYEAFRKAQLGRVQQENLKFLRGSAQILLAPGQSE
ncbi:MAG TPA: peptidylprolyl isomerase [Xanthobacteraceae bacterium]|jgi:hypothetical protein